MEEGAASALTEGPTPLQKKHAAMIDRLNARHQQQLQSRSSSSSTTASLQSFLDRFSAFKIDIQSATDRCRGDFALHGSVPQLKSDLEKVTTSIVDLERFVAESSYLLPPYEVRSSLGAISGLKEDVERVSGELIPRKKFSFRNKPAKKEGSGLVPKVDEMKLADVEWSDLPAAPVVVTRDSPGFRNREGAVLVKDFRGVLEKEGDFSLTDLDSCEVYLRGRFRALFVHRLRNCRVFVGPVLGSVLIEDVQACVFMLASHQIRIHEARETDFYLRVRSRPIIEYCTTARFGPYQLFYEGIEEELRHSGLAEETGNWANVDDFRWLRAVQSPNWRVLEKEEQEATVNITDVGALS